MIKEEVMSFLLELLSAIRMHSKFLPELVGCIAMTGQENRFKKILIKQLRILSYKGIQASDMAEFESIGDGLFSMHIAGKQFNTRVLYFFLPNQQPVFLLAFEERAGKRKTDYSTHIPIALARMHEIEEAYQNEQ